MRAIAVLGTLLLASCGKTLTATEVMVSVDAESRVKSEASKLRIVVSGSKDRGTSGDREPYDRTFKLDSDDFGWRHETALAPLGGEPSRVYEFTATALDDAGETVAQVKAISGYVEHKRLTLRLLLEDSCIRKTCSDEQTCRAGQCVSAEIDPNSIESLGGARSGQDADTAVELDSGQTVLTPRRSHTSLRAQRMRRCLRTLLWTPTWLTP